MLYMGGQGFGEWAGLLLVTGSINLLVSSEVGVMSNVLSSIGHGMLGGRGRWGV